MHDTLVCTVLPVSSFTERRELCQIRQYEDGITSNGVEEHTESATLVDGGDGGPTVDEKGEQDFFDHDSPTEQGLDRKKVSAVLASHVLAN